MRQNARARRCDSTRARARGMSAENIRAEETVGETPYYRVLSRVYTCS